MLSISLVEPISNHSETMTVARSRNIVSITPHTNLGNENAMPVPSELPNTPAYTKVIKPLADVSIHSSAVIAIVIK